MSDRSSQRSHKPQTCKAGSLLCRTMIRDLLGSMDIRFQKAASPSPPHRRSSKPPQRIDHMHKQDPRWFQRRVISPSPPPLPPQDRELRRRRRGHREATDSMAEGLGRDYVGPGLFLFCCPAVGGCCLFILGLLTWPPWPVTSINGCSGREGSGGFLCGEKSAEAFDALPSHCGWTLWYHELESDARVLQVLSVPKT